MQAPDFPNVLVVGMHFRGAQVKELVASFQPPVDLQIIPEPENQYDQNALKVMYNGIHVGYIERGQAAFITPWIEKGVEFACTVNEMKAIKNNLHPVVTLTPVEAE